VISRPSAIIAHPNFFRMPLVLNTFVYTLLACVTAAPVAAQRFQTEGTAHQQPAGCHGEGAKAPANSPVTHQCCQSGHDAAGVQKHAEPMVARAAWPLTAVETVQRTPVRGHLVFLTIQSGDPPGVTALRI